MKSPVFGLGRNRKHNKSHNAAAAANINLRGKKYKIMGCYCCFCIDTRDEIKKRIHYKEIRNAFYSN